MKLKILFFLFTFVLLGAVAPKAFLELRSDREEVTISWPQISFHTPEFKQQNLVYIDKTGIKELSVKLTKAYQQGLYEQWENRKPKKQISRVTTPKITIKKASSVAAVKKPTPKNVMTYKKAPTYRYRQVEMSKGEINSKELIEHYGFKVNGPKVGSWSASYNSSLIASTLNNLQEKESARSLAQVELNKVDEIKETDKVEVKQAAVAAKNDRPKENEYSAKEMDDETWEEELVMIDYSDEDSVDTTIDDPVHDNALTTQEAMQLLTTAPNESELNVNSMSDDLTNTNDISASVMSAISREMDKRDSIPTVATVGTQKNDYSKKGSSTRAAKSTPKKNTRPEKSDYSGKTVLGGRSLNTLSIHEVLFGQDSKMKELRNFEFFAETLYGESYTDGPDGKVKIDFNLSSSMGVLRGTVLKHGYMRTKVDLVLEPGKFDVQVPLIEQDAFSRFLDREGIYGRGGYVLVRLPQKADTVDIDARYEAKVFLNEDLDVVDENEYFEFVLFAGVEPGNLLISYKNINEKIADKISHVVEDEVLFESGIMIESEQLYFNLEEKNMLSRKNSSVNIHPDQINYFNRRTQASQQAVSSYSIQTPFRALGMRDYLEMRHTQIPMFVGLWSNKNVELPSENFANYILESHQLNSLQNACMVQINISKPLRNVNFFGETKRGPMGIVQSYLDEDGEFNYDPSEMASHIFLIGDLQGTISGKLEYADGSYDFIQTFCSSNTYLVEQL